MYLKVNKSMDSEMFLLWFKHTLLYIINSGFEHKFIRSIYMVDRRNLQFTIPKPCKEPKRLFLLGNFQIKSSFSCRHNGHYTSLWFKWSIVINIRQ